MEYLVVPFTANIKRSDNSVTVAGQVQAMIDHHVQKGWEYVRLESIETAVSPTSGCFGFGAQPGYLTSYQMLVFRRATS